MRMFSEEQVLNQAFRASVIADIKSQANQARKREALKRQDCFRDNTIKWVLKSLNELGLKKQTIDIMQNHASNISIVKKVVNKKARAYRAQVSRSTMDEAVTAQIMELAATMNINEQLKKADVTAVLQNNALLMVLPEQTPEKKVCLRPAVLGPWQYDVIEDARNPERPACVILSEWKDINGTQTFNSDQIQAIDASAFTVGEATIAHGPHVTSMDQGCETFIWWTNSYHMTTDASGRILDAHTPVGLVNPIGMIPAASINQNQDGAYWGKGGEDLVDGAVLINLMCTDMNAIMYAQGWGQLVISGPNIPTEYSVGPHVALALETREGQSAPDVKILSNNPPIDSWLKVIEQYVAMLLSTNDISASTVSMKLDAANFPSGVAMLIDKSEATGSIEDRRHAFAAAERRIWRVVSGWLRVYGDATALDHEFAEIGQLPDDIDVSIRFQGEEQIITEKEKLDILKQRKEMGLITQLDLIKADNPHMTDEEAAAKLEQIRLGMDSVVKEATAVAAKMVDSGSVDDNSMDNEQDRGPEDQAVENGDS